MAKANRSRAAKAARKTHVTTLMEIHRRLLAGVAKMPSSPEKFLPIKNVGTEIENALATFGVNPDGEPNMKTGWVFTTPWSRADRNYARRKLCDSLLRLQDASNLAEHIFTKEAGPTTEPTPEACAGFIRASIDYAGRDLERLFPDFGLAELKRDERLFLEE